MADQLFKVVFRGRLLEGYEQGAVRGEVGRIFKMKNASLDQFFSGRPVVIKRGMDRQEAERICQAFAGVGAACEITAMDDSTAREPESSPAPNPAFVCPRCNFEQPPGSHECLKCGVIFAKVAPPPPVEEPAVVVAAPPAPADHLQAVRERIRPYREWIVHDQLYFGETIPRQNLQHARATWAVDSGEQALFFYDPLGDGQEGMLITEQGIYGKGPLSRFTVSETWDEAFSADLNDGLVVNGKTIHSLKSLPPEMRVLVRAMLQDAIAVNTGQVLLPHDRPISFPDICPACHAESPQKKVSVILGQTVEKLAPPPEELTPDQEALKATLKVAGFVAKGILFNISPLAFFMAEMQTGGSKRNDKRARSVVLASSQFHFCPICRRKISDASFRYVGTGLFVGGDAALGDILVRGSNYGLEIQGLDPIFAAHLLQSGAMTTHFEFISYAQRRQAAQERAASDIRAAFMRYVRPLPGFMVHPDIPEKKLTKAMETFAALAPGEDILALYSHTSDILFTTFGVHMSGWENRFASYYGMDPDLLRVDKGFLADKIPLTPDIKLGFSLNEAELGMVIRFFQEAIRLSQSEG